MKAFIAQLIKDGKLIRREAVLWAFLMGMVALSCSPWVIGWAVANLDPANLHMMIGLFALEFLATLIIGWAMASRLLYADAPLRNNAFWLSRPVGPDAMVASKAAWILGLAIIVPLAIGVPLLVASGPGSGWLGFWWKAFGTFAVLGLGVFAAASLTRSGRDFALGLATLVVLAIVVQFAAFSRGRGWSMEGFTPIGLEASRVIVALVVVAVGAMATAWLQYRERRFVYGLAAVVATILAAATANHYWPLNFRRTLVPESIQVGVGEFDPYSVSASQSTHNDVSLITLRIEQTFPELEPGFIAAPVGIDSRLVSDRRVQRYAGELHASLVDQAAASYGLTAIDSRFSPGSSINLEMFVQRVSDFYLPGEQFQTLEGTVQYRVYRVHEPLRLTGRAERVRWRNDSVYLLERSLSSGPELQVQTLELTSSHDEQDGLLRRAAFLADPGTKTWFGAFGGSGSGVQGFRDLQFSSYRFRGSQRTRFVDGEAVQTMVPSRDWLAGAEIWQPVLEFVGTFTQSFSIDLRPFQNGDWLAFPRVEAGTEGRSPSADISFVNLAAGKTPALGFGMGQGAGPWNMLWIGPEEFLFWYPENRLMVVTLHDGELGDRKATEADREAMRRARERHRGNGIIPPEGI